MLHDKGMGEENKSRQTGRYTHTNRHIHTSIFIAKEKQEIRQLHPHFCNWSHDHSWY